MKSKLATLTLVLGLCLTASAAHAQEQLSGQMGHSLPQSDPNITYNGSNIGVYSTAGTGSSSAHSISIRWEADLSAYSESVANLPIVYTISYKLNNYASGDVSLLGVTPPSGGGQGYGSVANALGNTGNVGRRTTPWDAHATAGPLEQFKSVTVAVEWVKTGNGTYSATVILETNGQTTQAHVDPLPSQRSGSLKGGQTNVTQTPESAGGATSQGGTLTYVGPANP